MEKSAAQKVFGVAELLEAILLLLPPKDILVLQRVSKDFRNAFTGSSKLKAVVYPAIAPIQSFDGDIYSGTFKYAITIPGFPPLGTEFTPVVPNPLLFDFRRLHYTRTPFAWHFPPLAVNIDDNPLVPAFDVARVNDRSSCLDMYITNPPVSAVNLVLREELNGEDHSFRVGNSSGVTYGDVYRRAKKIGGSIQWINTISEVMGQTQSRVVRCVPHYIMDRVALKGYVKPFDFPRLMDRKFGNTLLQYLSKEDRSAMRLVSSTVKKAIDEASGREKAIEIKGPWNTGKEEMVGDEREGWYFARV